MRLRFQSAIYLVLVVILLSAGSSTVRGDQPGNIERIFEMLELQGVDTGAPLLYGYFFLADQKDPLETIWARLGTRGYRLRRLEATDDGSFILHIDRVEEHSVATLRARCNEMTKLVHEVPGTVFDGWDVGHRDESRPLVATDEFLTFFSGVAPTEREDLLLKLMDHELFDEALLALDWCIRNDIDVAQCTYRCGCVKVQMGLQEQAIADIQAAIALEPDNFKFCFGLAATYAEIDDCENSILYYRKALELDRTSSDAHYGIAACQYMQGRYGLARESCQEALRLDPHNWKAKDLMRMLDG